MNQEKIEEAKEVIKQGGIVIFPTETAYGIAADATNPEAIEKVYNAKERPRSKGLTAIVDSLETAEKYAHLNKDERKLIKEFMPGPLTLVSKKKENIPDSLNTEFAFRISSGNIASELAEVGPITATSANISGEDTSYSVEDISDKLLEQTDHVIDIGELNPGPTSTIAEVNNSELVIHRRGPISEGSLREVLNE